MEFTEILMSIFTSEAFVNAVVAIIVAMIGVVAKYVTAFIEAKTENMKKRTQSEELRKVLDLVSDNAAKVVRVIEETVVKDLREKTADGKLDSKDIEEIQKRAKEMMIQTLSEESVNILQASIGNMEEYTTLLIEAALASMKEDKGIVNKIVVEDEEYILNGEEIEYSDDELEELFND